MKTSRASADPSTPSSAKLRKKVAAVQAIEPLEARIAPATFTGAATTLTIDLNNANELITFSTDGTTITATLSNGTAVDGGGTGGNVTGFGSTLVQITSAAFNTITITDSSTANSVAFANSTSGYSQAFNVTLNNTGSGNLTFAGSSTFASTFAATLSTGFITSDSASQLTLAGAANLNLTATGHDVLLAGVVSVPGTTSINAGVIQADNAGNNFLGAVQLQGTAAARLVDIDALILGASNFTFGSAAQTIDIKAGGNITQTGAITATGNFGSTLSLTSTGGSITLTAANNIAANVGLAITTTGANGAAFTNSPGTNSNLALADISMQTGSLTLISNGTVAQRTGSTIDSDGAISITVGSNNRDITLGNADNQMGGTITVGSTAANFLRDVTIRNASDSAIPPVGTPLNTVNDVRNVRLTFDNTGIALPTYAITGSLTVLAGGDITQTAALAVGGAATFTVIGDHAITLTNAANSFGTAVGFNAPQSTQPIQVAGTGGITLTASDLGRGALSVTAATGNISQSGSLVMEKGAAPATFTVTTGTSVTLTNSSNIIPGGVIFAGAGLTTVNYRNADFTADFGDLTIPNTVANLTVRFDNAAVALPSLGTIGTPLTSLTVTAPGIVQQVGTSINATTASFNSLNFPLDLSNTTNDFNDITLTNSGRNDLKLTDVDDLNFAGTSNVGTGRLTITAGAITDTGTIVQAAAGPVGEVTFVSSGSITLDSGHTFRGPVNATVTGVNTADIRNNGVTLTLGKINSAVGAFSATATNADIVQDPNSVLTIGGNSSFTATGGGDISLTNTTNSFAGSVALSGGNVALQATGSVVLGAGSTGNLTVTSGGAAGNSINQSGALNSSGTAKFNSGAGSIVLTNAANDFNEVGLFSTGPSVAITDSNALTITNSVVGGAAVTITAGGDIDSTGSFIQTTGTGTITLDTPSGNDTNLDDSGNVLLGPVNIVHSTDIRVISKSNLTFAPGSVVTGNFTATSGGVLTLPSALTNLSGFIISATSTTIGTDIAVTSGGIDITGKLSFSGSRSLTTTNSGITLRSGLETSGALTFNLGASQQVVLLGGDWNQGANPLTINGTGVAVTIGGVGRTSFNMTSGTISMPGGGSFNLGVDATFRVGSTSAAETVTLANEAGTLSFGAASSLTVGFGTTNDQLIKSGSGTVLISSTAKLVGTGLAGSSASPVLFSQTGLLAGKFANSFDANGVARDFFAGSDIVTPAYDFTQLTVKAGGTVSASGSVSGILPDGDQFTVASSLGASAGLVVSQEADGTLAAVVRNNTAAGASKLTITTAGGGNGRVPVSGIMVHSPGAVGITAASSDFTGLLTTAGTLASLVSRDLGVSSPLRIIDGGPVSAKTSITAHEMASVDIRLVNALDSLKAVSASLGTQITADKFGKIVTTGDLNGSNSNLPGLINPGNFIANLISTTATNGVALSSATIAGELGGTWDLRGGVGKVTARLSNSWTLGLQASGSAINGGLLTTVGSVALGEANGFQLNASGAVSALSFAQLSGAALTAGSYGAINVTGNIALGFLGSITGSNITATGNVGGVALKSLTVAGMVDSSNLRLLDGDATAIVIKDTLSNSSLVANDVNNHGNFKSLTIGLASSSTIDARTIGTLKVVGNLPAGRFGNFDSSTVTLHGNSKGVALATFDAQGRVSASTFNIEHGNVTTFKVARELGSTDVLLTDSAFGQFGSIQAGEWTSGNSVLAKTIASVASVGAPAVLPASPLLLGGIDATNITAYQNNGTAASITKFSAKGGLTNSNISAENGIGSLVVGRDVANSVIVADDSIPANAAVGRVATLTAGAWNNSSISANTLGIVKITGFATPEGSSAFVLGDVSSAFFLAHGTTPTKPAGIDSFTISSALNSSTISAPSGIKSLTIVGLQQSSTIVSDNPTTPSAGYISALSVGTMSNSTIRAGSLGAVKVPGSVPFDLLGNVSSSSIAATSGVTVAGATQGLGSLTINGDFLNSSLDVQANVGSINIVGQSISSFTVNRISAGYGAGSKLASFTAGNLSAIGTIANNLVSQAIGTLTVKGNASRGFVGTLDNAYVDILGSSAGVGLGTFTANGAATNSVIRVNDGDVTSFSILRMVSSDLLVGFRFDQADDITATVTGAQWTATNHKIGTFKTTAPFDSSDVTDSASFVDSNVIAGILGSITISGVNPDTIKSSAFGVAFRTSAGASAAGTVKINGAATALTAPNNAGQFTYLGLAG